jgi:dUTP pyrophosphatase
MDPVYILYIKPANKEIYQLYKNHSTYHEGDAGLDLFCPEEVWTMRKSLSNQLNFQIKCEMKKVYYNSIGVETSSKNVSYLLVPRSSISKTPLRQSNSIGVIDAGYRGDLMAMIDCHSKKDFQIKKGDRLFQIVLPMLKPFSIQILEEDEELSKTTRGEGGFGSTGK